VFRAKTALFVLVATAAYLPALFDWSGWSLDLNPAIASPEPEANSEVIVAADPDRRQPSEFPPGKILCRSHAVIPS
jgi:hypothetical protein